MKDVRWRDVLVIAAAWVVVTLVTWLVLEVYRRFFSDTGWP